MKLGVKEMKKAYKQVKIEQIEVSCLLVFARHVLVTARLKINVCDKKCRKKG